MNMRTRLSEWADKTFGKINHADFFHLNEIGEIDKEQNVISHIVMELKKEQGWKREWTSDEMASQWESELMQIVGSDNILKIEISSSEANQNVFIGGIRSDKEGFISEKSKIYGYRFKFEVMKKLRKRGISDESSKQIN